MSTVIKDLGAVSAYAYAVEKGYTGTEAEFAELMADYAEVGQRAEDAAGSALNSKTAAQTAATTATNKASEATTAATTATNKASEAQTSAQTASTKASEASQSASQASGYAQTAETAKTDAQTAKTQADTARDEAVTAKTAAVTAQGKAEDAQAAAESVAESIPSDYSQLSEDVSDLKEGLSQVENYIVDGKMLITQNGDIRDDVYIRASAGVINVSPYQTNTYISYIYEIEQNAKYVITTNGNRLLYGLYNSIEQNAKPDAYFNANDSIEGEHEIANDASTYLVVYCGYDFEGMPATTVRKVVEKADAIHKTHFNILIFGNSYAADAWGYVPFILKKYGITANIYMYYRGSGSPSRLVAEWEDTDDNGYDIYGGAHVRRMTHIDTRTMSKWTTSAKGYSAKMLLELANDPANGIDKWDIITLQLVSSEQYQVDGQWTMAPGIEPALRQIINLINASYSNTYTLGFLETYNRIVSIGGVPISVLDNRIATMQANEAAYKAEPFALMLPVGAAVFSGRTNTLLASTDVSDMGNLWADDLTHLQEGVPCYLAACTVCQAIFNKYFPEYSVLGDDTRITPAVLTNWNVQFKNGNPKEASELAYQLAQKCAVVANERPFDISPIYMPDDTAEVIYDRPKYWADSLIDTSNITNPTEQDENA